jgi:4-hydroxy-tetrahydrodipicolinate synthase
MGNKIYKLRGPCVALPTPFRDGVVDFSALDRLCQRQIDHGTAALVPCGPTGEAALLTPGEHHRIVERTVIAAAGRVPVIAGAGSNSTQAAVELARSAELAGAQALLCITPHALVPSQAGLIAHFQAIHEAVRIPIILHDVAPRTARPMADATIERLAELPRVVGLKDATGDIARVERMRWRLGDRFLLLSGDDTTQAAHRRAGGDGCISVTANVAPALAAALHKACEQGQSEAVARLAGILAPLHAALLLEANPIPVKRALHRLGLMVDGLRLPLTPLGAMGDIKLARVLHAILPIEKEQQALRGVSGRPPVRSRAA